MELAAAHNQGRQDLDGRNAPGPGAGEAGIEGEGQDEAADNGEDNVEDAEDAEEDEEEDETVSSSVTMMPLVLGPNDERRMHLTEEEHAWALEIKQAIEDIPELDNLSDFLYAQFALTVEVDDFQEVLTRAYNLQRMRNEYNIVDNYATAKRALHQALDLYGEMFLSCSFAHDIGGYCLAVDLSKQPTIKQLESHMDGMKIKLHEIFFSHHLFCPDFESIRKGYTILAECSGMNMVVDLRVFQLGADISAAYPIKARQLRHYHVGVFGNIFLSMVR